MRPEHRRTPPAAGKIPLHHAQSHSRPASRGAAGRAATGIRGRTQNGLTVQSRTITWTLAGLLFSWHGPSCVRLDMGDGHADLSAQAGDDHAEHPGGDPGEPGAGLVDGGALLDLRADGLEMTKAGRRSRPQPHRAQAADDAVSCPEGGCRVVAEDPAAAARRPVVLGSRHARVAESCRLMRWRSYLPRAGRQVTGRHGDRAREACESALDLRWSVRCRGHSPVAGPRVLLHRS